MEWNRELASNFTTIWMLVTLFFLILKKKKLGEHINIFTYSLAVGTAIEIFNIFAFINDPTYNSIPLYVVGVNVVVFLLFFLYFHQLLQSRKLKRINLILIALFIGTNLLSILFAKDYFVSFPFLSHFILVTLLTVSIFLVMSQTFNSDKILQIKNYYPFWVCIALMLIYLGVMPLLIISRNAVQMMNMDIFFIILFMVNIIGYSILIIGTFFARDLDKTP